MITTIPLPPKGMRDFFPAEVVVRRRVIGVLQEVFESYGYAPLETPALERLEVLTGKYGDDADRLIFRIQKRGAKEEEGSDLGLRYDLTVPLSRAIAGASDLKLPFKRYQIQPVWRAERPQKGRLREFYQCDVDCIGSRSPLADAEIIAIVYHSLRRLGFPRFVISLNHRVVLAAFISHFGVQPSLHLTATRALDKIDKIGPEGVREELIKTGVPDDDALALVATFQTEKKVVTFEEYARTVSAVVTPGTPAAAAWEEMETMRGLLNAAGVPEQALSYDIHLARGLDYYTGPIFEALVPEAGVGSVAGGGRYDHLISRLGGPDVPATGASLGLERLFVAAHNLRGEGYDVRPGDILVTVFDRELAGESVRLAAELRAAGLRIGLYPDETAKISKQLSYAAEQGYPFVIILGPDEVAAGVVSLKDLRRREQRTTSRSEVIAIVKDAL